MDKIQEFLKLLKAFQANTASIDDVVPVFEELDYFHHFWHYIDDADIRSKNSDYAKMQNEQLDMFIAALEVGDYKKANEVAFLQ
ncbi:hypothetical protein [Kangiella aquimarina]|uniref:Uncharacterized protein n=1 Tax=Kangiella aquimarina TaxID=261965 RepID=A0ABZ0X1D1_9GAMM|nr:hypothetical protein [Kangiella aquimarina]WQG84325.1 hypothetical protein SR900_07580 [Kangiella aquimarina]